MKKKMNLFISWIPVLTLILGLYYAIQVLQLEIHAPVFLSGAVAVVVAVIFKGLTWQDVEQGILDSLAYFTAPMINLLSIGILMASWNIAGVTPTMVYYALNLMDPIAFLPLTLIICSIIAFTIGTSWITIATIGIVLVAIGEGYGIDRNIVIGAVISGAYFGDKVSIFSDTTPIAASVGRAKLFDHFRHMAYTTIPAYLISLTLFTFIGLNSIKIRVDEGSINRIRNMILADFMITPYLLILPGILLFLMMKRKSAVPTIFSLSILGGAVAVFYQNKSLKEVLSSFSYGYREERGFEIVDGLFNMGGMNSVLWSISLLFCSLVFVSIMQKSGMLQEVTSPLLKFSKTKGRLVLAATMTPILLNFVLADRYISLIVSGNIFREKFEEKGLAGVNLSRCLESSATVTAPLIPWSTSSIGIIAILGDSPWSYAPYCFFNILCPIVSIVYGFLGFTLLPLEGTTHEHQVKEKEKEIKVPRDEDKIEY